MLILTVMNSFFYEKVENHQAETALLSSVGGNI
jgi:hypothetical protein